MEFIPQETKSEHDLLSMEFDPNEVVFEHDYLTTAEQDQFMSKLRQAAGRNIKAVEVPRKILLHYFGHDYKPLYADFMNVRLYEKGKMEEAIRLDQRRVEDIHFPKA